MEKMEVWTLFANAAEQLKVVQTDKGLILEFADKVKSVADKKLKIEAASIFREFTLEELGRYEVTNRTFAKFEAALSEMSESRREEALKSLFEALY